LIEDLLTQTGQVMRLRVKVIVASGSSGVSGPRNGELVVRLHSSPERGKANRELLEVLGRTLGVPRTSLRLLSGETARHKVVAVPISARERVLVLAGRIDRQDASPHTGA
jgi:uncharacterized protein (TIGR00251 family)